MKLFILQTIVILALTDANFIRRRILERNLDPSLHDFRGHFIPEKVFDSEWKNGMNSSQSEF